MHAVYFHLRRQVPLGVADSRDDALLCGLRDWHTQHLRIEEVRMTWSGTRLEFHQGSRPQEYEASTQIDNFAPGLEIFWVRAIVSTKDSSILTFQIYPLQRWV